MSHEDYSQTDHREFPPTEMKSSGPTPQPPAPPKWAINAASEITDTFRPPSVDSEMDWRDIPWLAAIIQRHHAAAQAETVALLEEAKQFVQSFAAHLHDEGSPDANLAWNLADRLNHHLAQLKEGAT